MFPVIPLAKQQALTIGLTSYNGGVYFGLNADRDAMPDVDTPIEEISYPPLSGEPLEERFGGLLKPIAPMA